MLTDAARWLRMVAALLGELVAPEPASLGPRRVVQAQDDRQPRAPVVKRKKRRSAVMA
jgi:hypothetical protein